jgi:hypothetical protein
MKSTSPFNIWHSRTSGQSRQRFSKRSLQIQADGYQLQHDSLLQIPDLPRPARGAGMAAPKFQHAAPIQHLSYARLLAVLPESGDQLNLNGLEALVSFPIFAILTLISTYCAIMFHTLARLFFMTIFEDKMSMQSFLLFFSL